jgi:endonuclease/exonuclease/phosphatase (EEP) superfamily protein YafD
MRPVIAALLAVLFVAIPSGAAADTQITITTQNVRYSLPPWQAAHDIRQAAQHSSIVLLQEMAGRRAARYRPAGWASAQATGRPYAARECPALWSARVWSLRRHSTRLLARSDLFPSATRYASVTVLRHRAAGFRAAVVCLHLIPHVERHGRPTALPRQRVLSRELATVYDLARTLAARYRVVVVGGDWNINARADDRVRHRGWPARVMPTAGYRHQWQLRYTRPTLGRRWVDTLWVHGAQLRSTRTVAPTYSDHNGARVRIRLP